MASSLPGEVEEARAFLEAERANVESPFAAVQAYRALLVEKLRALREKLDESKGI